MLRKNLMRTSVLYEIFVSKMFAAAEAVQQAEEALSRLAAPCNLITEDSFASNPIAAMEPSAELQQAMAWKPAVETKASEALADLEAMFESNPLLPSIKGEVDALRSKIRLGRDLTDFEQLIAFLLKEHSSTYASEESAAKQSDVTKRKSFALVSQKNRRTSHRTRRLP